MKVTLEGLKSQLLAMENASTSMGFCVLSVRHGRFWNKLNSLGQERSQGAKSTKSGTDGVIELTPDEYAKLLSEYEQDIRSISRR